MPELPEVETIIRGLQQQLIGLKIVRIRVILPKVIREDKERFVSLLKGASVQGIKRRGKIILIALSNKMTILVHLKLSGQIIYTSPEKPSSKHTHLIFDLSDGNQLRYIDPRQFGYFLLINNSELSQIRQLTTLGPDPLKISLDDFKERISKRKGRIKSLLLNQSFLAGIGNIYADEILHQAQIHPLEPAQTISIPQIEKLYQSIKEILTEAIKQKGSSIRDYLDSSGQEGGYQKLHQVYQREGKPCFTCQTKIARLKIGSRSSYFCPNCQKER